MNPKNTDTPSSTQLAAGTQTPSANHSYPPNGEISLIDLWCGLIRRWKMITTLTFIGTLATIIGAIAYASFQTPVYKVTAFILPPSKSDIQSLKIPALLARQVVWSPKPQSPWTPDAPSIPRVDVESIYHAFEQTLISRELQSQFAREYNSPIRFVVRKESAITMTLILYSHDPDQAKDWVEQYTQYASQQTVKEIASELQHAIGNRIRVIEHAENSLRTVAKQRKEDQIIQLQEALDIAVRLGIVERIFQTPLPPIAVPLYYRGATMLRAEIQAMNLRKSDDFFSSTAHLREIQEWTRKLRNISIDVEAARAARIEVPDTVVLQSLSPSPKLIIVLGFVIALMAGIFGAFLVNLIGRYREPTKITA